VVFPGDRGGYRGMYLIISSLHLGQLQSPVYSYNQISLFQRHSIITKMNENVTVGILMFGDKHYFA
jgi:hypothetical protein